MLFPTRVVLPDEPCVQDEVVLPGPSTHLYEEVVAGVARRGGLALGKILLLGRGQRKQAVPEVGKKLLRSTSGKHVKA